MGNEIIDNNISSNTVNMDGEAQIRLPKDSSILTTGIIALPFSFGLIGIILAIITLVNASTALRTYNADPDKYLESSAKKVRSGKVCAIISLSLFGAGILVLLALSA
ncbi:MAG: hypothetical protein AB8B56_04260 [Crocinitomicaceae bacterium]